MSESSDKSNASDSEIDESSIEDELLDEDEVMSRLGAAAVGLEDSFAFGNKLPISSIVIKYLNTDLKTTNSLTLPSEMFKYNKETKTAAPTPEYTAFIDACEVSPFGDGKETRFDPNVRKALHIPSSRIVSIQGFSSDFIINDIHQALFPAEEKVHAELLKVNVYLDGGFFAAHRDTPRNINSVGSLVVALPCAHSGNN